jgi:ADP-ribose pyrophosphatase YjhB (NUDIX family)
MGGIENPRWLEWAQRLQAIAQTGLSYSKDIFDTERYSAIRGIAAEMMATGCGALDAFRFIDMFKGDAGYATPKVDVRAAAFDAGRVLLVRESEDGRWTLPGGWADVGEAPSLAAVREVREECGYEVMPTKLAAVYDRNQHGHPVIPFHAYKLFFICSITGAPPVTALKRMRSTSLKRTRYRRYRRHALRFRRSNICSATIGIRSGLLLSIQW